jgi:hypothetical protein
VTIPEFGIVAAAVVTLSGLFRLLPERSKLTAEALEKQAGTAAALFSEVERLRGLYLKNLDELQETAKKEAACHARCSALEDRLKVLEALVPMAYGARLLRNLGAIRKIFERVRDPLMLTSKVGGGTILWANAAF